MGKLLSIFLLVLTAAITQAQPKDYPIQSVPFTNVKFTDSFWLPRIKINHTVTIPASFERCESTGRVKNFEMAAAKSGKFCTIYPFDDTDIYKTIEGASFSMALYPDKKMDDYNVKYAAWEREYRESVGNDELRKKVLAKQPKRPY